MSHHVSASPSNPTGAVEVVRVSNSAATTAPVDGGSATAATGAGASAPVSTVSTPGSTPAAGQSGTPGANLPVPDIEQASNTIQGARADLARTAGAERRLDGFDGVGGGGGGGQEKGGQENAGQENANNAEGAVAQDNPDVNQLENQLTSGQQQVQPLGEGETDPRA